MAQHIYSLINELSFEGQFSPDDVAGGLLDFLSSCNRIARVGKDRYTMLYQASIYYREVSHGLTFSSALKTLPGEHKDKILLLKMNMDRAGWRKLEDSGFFIDGNDKYYVGTIDVSNSSLAEAYEYGVMASQEDCVIVINMPKSSFGRLISVKKESVHSQLVINAVNSEEEALSYLLSRDFKMPYDRNCTMHPLPEETILSNTALFKKTQRTNMGAYLFERIGHNELWCLDTLHVDGSAHFEIFSMSNDKWKGENVDLQSINPDYNSKKHKGSKIRD